jgi:hypothetical protein
MCKRLISLTSFVVVVALAGNAAAQLDPADVTDGHVYLFDNVGGNVPDDSANNNTANLIGSPQVVDSPRGKALKFNGTSDGVHLPDSAMIGNTGTHQNRTVIAVFNCADVSKSNKQVVFDEGGYTRGLSIYVHEGLAYGAGWNKGGDYSPEWNPGAFISAPIGSNEWHTLAIILRDGGPFQEDDKFEMWLDGVLIGKGPGGELRGHSNDNGIGYAKENVVFHDGNGSVDGHYFEGMIDEIWILNEALTQADLGAWAGKVWPFAADPDPADGVLVEATWASLAWKPGGFAVSHDVYFGTSFDDVNDGAEGAFVGNTMSTFQVVGFAGFPVAEGLAPGTIYYWRVDEINDANSDSPWKGDVWSFTVPSKIAYNPDPADGMRFVEPDVTLRWAGGFSVKLHTVYFGDNRDEVGSAVGGMPQADTFFAPGTLELDKTYYWRVDEFDGAVTNKGDVWSLTTLPPIPVAADPDLVAWWKLDEGMGTRALDFSGHGNNVTLIDTAWSEPGRHGDAGLEMKTGHGVIQNLTYADTGLTEVSVCAWIRTNTRGDQFIVSFDRDSYWRLQINGEGAGDGQVGWCVMTSSGQVDYGSITRVDDDAWHHVCGVFDKGRLTIYIDGLAEPSATGGSTFGVGAARPGIIGGNCEAGGYNGGSPVQYLDDIRIYTKALMQEDIVLVMRGDPLMAWDPSPASETTPDIDNVLPLTWSPGEKASSHEVYLGTDRDAVKAADASDTTGIHRGRQNGTSFTLAENIEWGTGPFYWRIDENNNDGTVTRGATWSFSVADFILVDDFEGYTDNDAGNQAIWQTWVDGFGVATNGSQVGYVLPPYAEQAIVNGGSKSMPLLYDNTAGVKNSEVALSLTAPRDWTRHGVEVLSLWFRGHPETVSSFTEGPAGSFTMVTRSGNAWGTSDQINYVYMPLTGAGSISIKVESITNTAADAKAGVMIRETLDPDSKHAFTFFRPDGGVRFNRRLNVGDVTANSVENGFSLPHWLKLERDASGTFTASHSDDGNLWLPVLDVTNGSFDTVSMSGTVHMGFALAGNNNDEACEFKFSDVQVSGAVTGQWQQKDVGILANTSEPLYVAVSNANGTTAVVANSDANASVTGVWTEWLIDLSELANQGVNLSNVDKIAIGLGTTGDPAATGGSGTMFIDDIVLLRPAPAPQP